jgi:hypothetical protein
MPELIRLQTTDFQFLVWANDIGQRTNAYNNTLEKRANLAPEDLENAAPEPHYSLRFAPEAHLINLGDEQTALTSLELQDPLFFENTQYQFEWVFFGAVTNARLVHRSKNVSDAFRFTPEMKTERGIVPARLTGSISTGNDVGWLRLPLSFELEGETHTQHIAFEVLPTKMALHQDLPAMYRAIDAVYPLWRFSLVERTEQDAASSKQRGQFPLMWLANFAALKERFEQGLKVICAAPHSRLQATVAHVKAVRLQGRLPHKLAHRVKQDLASGQYEKRYQVEKKQLSVDTPENRFIKMAVNQSKRQLAAFEAKLRQSNEAPEHQRLSESFLDELHSWQQPLQKVLNQSFLSEVGDYAGSNRESLVLQQRTGYSAVYRVWQELKFYLDVFGNQSSISMKSVAEIYEVWCFLCLKQILETDLGFELVENRAAKLSQNDLFEYQLKDGFKGAFRFKRSDGVTAKLAHEPKFTKKGKSIRSYLVSQEPDIVLEVTFLKTAKSEEQKQFIWLFDAKYRIKNDKNRFEDSSEDEDIETTDYVPDDAINQMHRYRDALIRLSESNSVLSSIHTTDQPTKKSRPVFGAFALYPGFFKQTTEKNPYADAIEEIGIGAFALLPSQTKIGFCGHTWLSEFLKAQIGIAPNGQASQVNENRYPLSGMAERLYVQEAARIPHDGMKQVLYADLTLTAALGNRNGRSPDYLDGFRSGMAKFYHIPVTTFLLRYQQHVVKEIRFIAIVLESDSEEGPSKIDRVWPVINVTTLPRSRITIEQSGIESESGDQYFLFELGNSLQLQKPIGGVPRAPFPDSMKLTQLSLIGGAVNFNDLEVVYADAIGQFQNQWGSTPSSRTL